MTANSFSSLSLDPPLILWSLSKMAPSLSDFVDAEHFAIHMLAQEHHSLSGHFAKASADKFVGIAHRECDVGVPILEDVLATLVCRNVTQYEGGDHLIFIGQIEQYQQRQGEPLVFHAGKYRVAAAHPELSN
jgi:flavin reductase (DIM6/NTAB) family NADH-FMN oxidoreductase RutF